MSPRMMVSLIALSDHVISPHKIKAYQQKEDKRGKNEYARL